MRAKTLQIVWHEKEPVFSLDFHPNGLLATAGADKEVKLWQVSKSENGDPVATHVGRIAGHSRGVNCVRFAPTGGDLLACAGDGGEAMLWRDTGAAVRRLFGSDEESSWQGKVLRGHVDDVNDAAWSPDGTALVTGSIENLCIVWDVEKSLAAGGQPGKVRLENHKHYVQGVAWDPAAQYVASVSSDRSCRVYGPRPPAAGKKPKAGQQSCIAAAKDLICQHVLIKRQAGMAGEQGAAPGVKDRHFMFHDETLPTFFRRFAWAPDGSCLVVPAGMFKASPDAPDGNATYLFARGHWGAPALVLPGVSKASVAVRFCPQLFQRRGVAATEGCAPCAFAELPYRLVFAVASLDSVALYDTESPVPLALLGALHFAAITDLAWSCDGRQLAVSSRDGYCSLVLFEEGELGEPVPPAELPPHIAQRLAVAQKAVKRPPPPPQRAATATAAGAAAAASAGTSPAVAPVAPAGSAAPAAAAPRAERGAACSPAAIPAPAGGKRRVAPEPVVNADAADLPAPVSQQPPGGQPRARVPEEQAKTVRRITPLPVAAARPVASLQQGAVVVAGPPTNASPAAAASTSPSSACKRRRITPLPVGPPAPLPGGAAAGAGARQVQVEAALGAERPASS